MTTRSEIDAILAEMEQAAQDARAAGTARDEGQPDTSLGAGIGPVLAVGQVLGERIHEPRPDWDALRACDDERFVQDSYRLILGREPDAEGAAGLRAALSTGSATRLGIVQGLLASPEAAGRNVAIAGLSRARLFERAGRLPLLGGVVRRLLALVELPRHLAVLERRGAVAEEAGQAVRDDVRAMAERLDGNARETRAAFSETAARIDELAVAAERRMDLLARELAQTRTQAAAALEEARATHRKTLIEAGRIASLLEGASAGLPARPQAAAMVADLEDHALDDLYLAFENRFRGSPEEIARRCERYLPVIAATPAVAAGGVVLDIGCGRGEWLSLLKRQGHAARGVDLNTAMVASARERGHEVVEGDAVAYLRALPEASLGAITGFHVVEHLPFRTLIALLDAASRALAPGGAVLFETPNPECIVVGACNFYYDPTHQNPLPPELLRFLCEQRGFASARVLRTDADCDLSQPESGFAPTDINAWFQMPMDYAVYGRRA